MIKKLRLAFLAICLPLLYSATANAQIGTNLDFSEGTPVTANLATGDKKAHSVTGWIGEGTGAKSWWVGGLLGYGSGFQLNGSEVPKVGPNGETVGNALGVSAAWGSGVQYTQAITLEPGNYIITIPIFARHGGDPQQAPAESYIGFVSDGGTKHFASTKIYTNDAWTIETIKFTLTETTAGKLSLGAKFDGGSGPNQRLFFDKVDIKVVTDVELARTELNSVITSANAILAEKTNVGDGLFMIPTSAWQTYSDAVGAAQDVSDNASATAQNLKDAKTTLESATNIYNNTPITIPDPSKSYTFKQVASGKYMAIKNKNISIEDAAALKFEAKGDGTYYLTDGVEYVYYSGTGDNKWSLSSHVTSKDAWTIAHIGEGKYTLKGKNDYLGTDNTNTGAYCFGNKGNNDKGQWIIEESTQCAEYYALENAIAVAKTALANADYKNVTGSEKNDLKAEIDKEVADNANAYKEAALTITSKTNAFVAAKDAYDKLVLENPRAESLGVTPVTIDGTMTAANAKKSVEDLMVAEYAAVTAAYTVDIELGAWTETGVKNFNNEHWSGTTHNYKNQNDDNGQGWNANSWTMSCKQDITLPAGEYVFRVAARRSDLAVVKLVVKNGDTSLGEVNDFPVGSVGRGITTSGVASFSETDTYANKNNGYGWQWRYVPFTLDAETTVSIAVEASANAKYQWASFGDYTVKAKPSLASAKAAYNAALDAANAIKSEKMGTAESTALNTAIGATPEETIEGYEAVTTTLRNATTNAESSITAYASLKTAIDAAEAITDVNVGDAAFQIPTSSWQTLQEAIKTAEDVYTNATASLEGVNQAVTNINATVATYKSSVLNTPADGSVFNVMITTNDGWALKDRPVTFADESADYSLKGGAVYQNHGINANRAQQIVFKQVEGNKYTLSTVNAAGKTVYFTTGKTGYGGNVDGIRITTEEGKALPVEIILTSREGVYNLKNTEANGLLGCWDEPKADNGYSGGIYTTRGSHSDFTITPAIKPSVEIKIAAGKYATRIFPFKPTLPEGVEAYSCSAVEDADNTVLVLVNETELKANTPYILENTTDTDITEPITGFGSAEKDTYNAGWLTGTFEAIAAENSPVGSYVMQTVVSEDKQNFYQIADADKVAIPAYRAYLTLPEGSAKTRSLSLGESDGETTAINAIFSENEVVGVYSVNGVRQNSLQKGLNIIKMSDGTTQKVLVK